MAYDSEIRRAIRDRRLLEFQYNGGTRIVEPHVYGVRDGEHQLLSFQVGGHSGSGELPNWRSFRLSKMEHLKVLEELFDGPRQHRGRTDFDSVLLVVR